MTLAVGDDIGHFHAADALAAGSKAVLLTHDDVLRNIDQTAGEVTGVCGLQSGIGQALTSAVRGGKELQHGQALAEVRADR